MLHFCFGLAKATWPPVKETNNEIPLKNRANLLNSPFTLGAERSKKLSDKERITFGIGAFQVIIVTKIVLDQV